MGREHPFCKSPQKIKLRPLALQPTANLHLPAVGGAGGQRKEPTAPAGSHRLFLCKTPSPVRELQHTGHCLTPRATEQNPSFVTIALDPRRRWPPGVSFQRLQLHKTMSFLFNCHQCSPRWRLPRVSAVRPPLSGVLHDPVPSSFPRACH